MNKREERETKLRESFRKTRARKQMLFCFILMITPALLILLFK